MMGHETTSTAAGHSRAARDPAVTWPSISEQDIRAYEEDGVVCLRGHLAPEWVDRIYRAADRVLHSGEGFSKEATQPGESGRFFVGAFMSHWDPEFRKIALECPAAGIAARLLRQPSVNFFYDQLLVKEPDTQAVTSWHHDLPYWPFRGNDLVSVWIALVDVSIETSGLEYVAGSHRWGKLFRAVTTDRDPSRSDLSLEECPNFSEQANRRPELRFLSWDLKAGDCICHHPLTVHGAGGNRSKTQRRLALSLRYMGVDALWDPRVTARKLPWDPHYQPGLRPLDDQHFPRAWPPAAPQA